MWAIFLLMVIIFSTAGVLGYFWNVLNPWGSLGHALHGLKHLNLSNFIFPKALFLLHNISIEMSQCEKSFSKAWKFKPWSLWCWDEIGNHSASSVGTNGSQAGNSGMPPASDIITDPLSLSILSDGLQHQVGSLSKFLQACKTSKPFSN